MGKKKRSFVKSYNTYISKNFNKYKILVFLAKKIVFFSSFYLKYSGQVSAALFDIL